MLELPHIDENEKKLMDMIYAPIYTKVLFAGIELDIFSELENSNSYEKISEKLNLNPDNTRYLLDALTSIDLLKKEASHYENKDIFILHT